jgi:hypothetical protein
MCILIFDDMYHLLLVKTLLFLPFMVLQNGLLTADRVDSDVWSRIRAKHNF